MKLRTYISQKICHGVPCIICGEMVELSEIELNSIGNIYKVCNKCREAVLKLREQNKSKKGA